MFQADHAARRWLVVAVNKRLVALGQEPIAPGEREELSELYDEDLEAAGRSPSVADTAADWIVRERAKHPPYRGAMRQRAAGPNRSRRTRNELEWHEWAVTEIFAAHADQDAFGTGVKRFREQVLNGRLLDYADAAIGSWIMDQQRRDSGPGRVGKSEFLLYGVPSGHSMLRVPTRPGGVLDRLRQLSERLAANYDWDAGQATIFVLTGATPVVHAIRSSVRNSSPLRARSRITLVIDPTCTPYEVAEEYRRVRTQFGGGRRVRRVGERQARLAAFAFSHVEPPGAQMMDGWNAWCRRTGRGRWTYRFASQFEREAQRAFDSVVELISARSSRSKLRIRKSTSSRQSAAARS